MDFKINRPRAVILGLIVLTALFMFQAKFRGEEPRLPSVAMVTIREGLTAVETSELLRDAGVLREGVNLPGELEGYLFPDTYEFYIPSSLSFVVNKLTGNFNDKVLGSLPSDGNIEEIITVASLLEREVRTLEDKKLVAGIIWKRLKYRMPLQIDASICYIKPTPCHPITKGDLQIDSPYNTYKYKGLPPGPISNPGFEAILASVEPVSSKYWFYISDPKTGRTIFSVDLDEHNKNVAKYLRGK